MQAAAAAAIPTAAAARRTICRRYLFISAIRRSAAGGRRGERPDDVPRPIHRRARTLFRTHVGRSSDSLPFRRLPAPSGVQWLSDCRKPFATHSSGNCCRFARHSLFTRNPRRGFGNRCTAKIRFFGGMPQRLRQKRLTLPQIARAERVARCRPAGPETRVRERNAVRTNGLRRKKKIGS